MPLDRTTTIDGSPAELDRRKGHRFAAVSLALAMALGAAACSDDSSTSASKNTGNLPTAPNESVVMADFCASATSYAGVIAGAPQDPTEMEPFLVDTLVPATEALVATLPPELHDAGETLTDAVGEAAETGDPSGVFGPAGAEAQNAVGEAVHEDCGVQQVTVHAVEYAFHGVPSTLEAGPTSFELVNDGVEEHEMVLFKRADGATESLTELLELPEEQGMAKMEFTGVAFGGPGSTSYAPVELEPGTYFLVCFIPVGGGEDGPPHFMQGMQQTITVA
jgi:hypothetical protein